MNKYSTQQAGEYSRKLAKLLSDKFFQDKSTITGPELMSFCPVKQINLLVVKELLGTWHREMASLKSPYFDYEAEPVKASLAEFMNVLSQHILISRRHFEPLAERAVYNTLQLALDTTGFFESVFLQNELEVDPGKLKSYLRYLDFGRELFAGFLEDLHLGNVNRDFVLQRFKLYLNAHYKDQLNPSDIIAELNALLPVSLADLEEKPASPGVAPSVEKEAPEAPKLAATAPEPTVAPAIATPVAPKAPAAQPVAPAPAPAPKPQPEPAVVNQAPKPVEVSRPAETAPKEPAPAQPAAGLNDRFKTEHTSLNDKLRKPAAATLADTIGERKIESLKNSISINQRFAFINELFGGDNQAYHAAINQLDEQPTLELARDFVLTHLQKAYDWNVQGEHVTKLLRLVDRKFA